VSAASGAPDVGDDAEPAVRPTDAGPPPVTPDEILIVRRGPGANCSSIGSALDVLFMTATLAGAILVGVAAAIGEAAPRRAARGDDPSKPSEPPSEESDAADPR